MCIRRIYNAMEQTQGSNILFSFNIAAMLYGTITLQRNKNIKLSFILLFESIALFGTLFGIGTFLFSKNCLFFFFSLNLWLHVCKGYVAQNFWLFFFIKKIKWKNETMKLREMEKFEGISQFVWEIISPSFNWLNFFL